ILALSAVLNMGKLTSEGYGNTYFAATVKNMLTSWHNFFFVSFDAGFVSVDKPPLGLWIQAASAKVFGFHGWSIMLPQAVAGVLSVALLYYLVRRASGPVAGLLAALTLALTPISVAVNHHNNLESVLVLTMLLAAWAFMRAAETGRLPWLLLGAVLIGLGFNIKMLAAFLIVPACYLLYLVADPGRLWRRMIDLALATVVLLAVSLSWAVVVDLTPAGNRPYIGGSANNTVLDLIVGFNGASRLTGSDVDVGERGPLRLLQEPVVGQIGWLLPLVAVGLVAAIGRERPHFPLSRQQQALVLWGTWFVSQVVFFSIAGDWDLHYLAVLSPAVAALLGMGVLALWHDYRTPGWRGWLLPLTLAGTAALQTRVLSGYTDWVPWVQPAVVILSLVAVVGLVAVRLVSRPRGFRYSYPLAAVSIGLVALLLAPSLWSASATWYSVETRTPSAGPQAKRDRAASSQFVHDADPLLEYLQTNRGEATYLVASADRDFARYAILNTDDPLIAFGGFSGRDPVLSNERLVSLIDTGAVRYFLVESSSGKKNSVGSWIIRNCELLPKITWQPRTAARKKDANGMDQVLFDCGRSRES
ncbi:MAG: glycosyltransferase family 39 protein, partial [Chloroflexota bacterium]|nr:glycosyltransferase family 39 protein [Chloroflexota bacterium]